MIIFIIIILFTNQFRKRRAQFFKALKEYRIKLTALSIQNHLNCCIMIKCFLVTSFTSECIININD